MKTLAAILVFTAGAVVAQNPLHSTCILVSDGVNGFGEISGVVDFHQKLETDPIHVTGEIYGLTEGNHGFHIHTFPVDGDNCTSTGGHFNPDGFNHGAPDSEFRHVGDLGNVYADSNGTVVLDIMDNVISLFEGDRLITGRAVVVHELEDDLGLGGDAGSLATGNAGARLACCTIERRG